MITIDEFIARPDRDDDQREELIEGEVIVSPGPRADHSEIVELLREQLSGLKQKGYVLRNDFSCILGGRSMPVPDLAVVKRTRWDKAVKRTVRNKSGLSTLLPRLRLFLCPMGQPPMQIWARA